MGPRERRSTTRSAPEEAAVLAFRVQRRLPLDDVYDVYDVYAGSPARTGRTRTKPRRSLEEQYAESERRRAA
jgi:hypothetical protein